MMTQYQIRIDLPEKLAEAARTAPGDPALKPLSDILAKHNGVLRCMYDAFADYVAEAAKQGDVENPLYRWTKATVEDPAKKEKYLKSFTIPVGGAEGLRQRDRRCAGGRFAAARQHRADRAHLQARHQSRQQSAGARALPLSRARLTEALKSVDACEAQELVRTLERFERKHTNSGDNGAASVLRKAQRMKP